VTKWPFSLYCVMPRDRIFDCRHNSSSWSVAARILPVKWTLLNLKPRPNLICSPNVMGVRLIFSKERATRRFFKNFYCEGPKVVKFVFHHLKFYKNHLFCCNYLKNPRGSHCLSFLRPCLTLTRTPNKRNPWT